MLMILKDLPISNVNISNKQQCSKVYEDMNFVGT